MKDRRRVLALLITIGIAAGGLATEAQAATVCDSMTTSIYTSTNPRLETDLLTTSVTEHSRAQEKYGYTADVGVLGLAASRPGAGLVSVSRLYNPKTVDFVWTAADADLQEAKDRGFQVQVPHAFYAASDAESCTVPVSRYIKGEHYAFATTSAERAKLSAAGWSDQGVVFHLKKTGTTPEGTGTTPEGTVRPSAPRLAADGTFSFAVIPDTQEEVNRATDTRMVDRAQWLLDNRRKLGLQYVLHTGDIVNWGDVDPKQYDIAQKSFAPLAQAGIPYAVAIGNHDTPAVGHNGVSGSRSYGGSAYANNPECKEKLGAEKCKTWLLIRDTEIVNQKFPLSSLRNVGGVFEAGKIDNMWTTFSAGGTDWLVLTLEFHARKEAIAWAKNVVASHRNHNVIVQTHSYLTANGDINQTTSGYGSTTGQYLFDNLIKAYPNIKMVFSGHVGQAAKRVDTGANGNKVLSFLGGFHSRTTNPVRIVTVDADTGLVSTKVVAPATNATMTQYATSDTISVIKNEKATPTVKAQHRVAERLRKFAESRR